MKILVTGASGFIGQHVLPLLQNQKADVAALTRNASRLAQKTKIIEASLEKPNAYKSRIKEFSPDVCLHLAWEGIPDYSPEVSKKNLDQSIGLIDFLLEETSCKKIVVGGSCFEYGNAVGPISETAAEQNLSGIASAKNSLKDYLALRSKEKLTDWIWLRLFYVFGPGQREGSLIPSLTAAALKKQSSPIRNPLNANDFIYIDDVARAFQMVCTQKSESGIYNIGSGGLFKVSDIWDLVQKAVNRQTSAPQNQAAAVGFYANIEKAKQKLNWSPQISTERGIRQFIDYLLNKGES